MKPACGRKDSMEMKIGTLRTSRVARFLGVSERQLRRLEQQGRIPTAKRDHLGRYYTVADLAALEKILQPHTD